MSEKLSFPETNTQPTPVEVQQNPMFGSDAGALDLGNIAKRTGEIGGDVRDLGRIAYHGIRAAIADRRTDWAADRVETMDHKDDFYAYTSAVARGDAVIPPVVQPASWPERIVDKKIHGASWEKGLKKAKQNEVDGAYNRKGVVEVPDTVRDHTEDIDQLFRTGAITAEQWQAEKAVIRDVTQRYRQNPPANPELNFSRTEGRATRADTKKRKRRVKQDYKHGRISATEKIAADQDISASPRAFENREQRKVRRATERAAQRLDRVADQPVLSRWRRWRRNEAEKDTDRHYDRATKHAQKHFDIKSDLAVRRAARP